MNRSRVDMLIEARTKIEKGWTKGHWAQDRYGISVAIDSKYAVKWCAIGACNGHNSILDILDSVLHISESWSLCRGIASFNDRRNTTKDDVLGLFDLAIARIDLV